MPLLTVLIPTYNCGQFINECLTSVFNQSFQDYEILIIDDGSTDDTLKIINTIADKRIRVEKNNVNRGIVYSLNKGIELSEGTYIARMDADDVMLGNRLEDQVKFLNQNPEYGLVGGWYKMVTEEGAAIKSIETVSSHTFLKLALIFRNQFAHSAITMRTEIVKKLKYDQNFIYCEDHELWIRFSEISKVTNLQRYYLSYRWYSNNTCQSKQRELKLSVMRLLSRELSKIGVDHNAYELMLHASLCFNMTPFLLMENKKVNALRKWIQKIFESKTLKDRYQSYELENLQRKILDHCGLQESNIFLFENLRAIKSLVKKNDKNNK